MIAIQEVLILAFFACEVLVILSTEFYFRSRIRYTLIIIVEIIRVLTFHTFIGRFVLYAISNQFLLTNFFKLNLLCTIGLLIHKIDYFRKIRRILILENILSLQIIVEYEIILTFSTLNLRVILTILL